jgi:hypothetical protein
MVSSKSLTASQKSNRALAASLRASGLTVDAASWPTAKAAYANAIALGATKPQAKKAAIEALAPATPARAPKAVKPAAKIAFVPIPGYVKMKIAAAKSAKVVAAAAEAASKSAKKARKIAR